MKDGLAEKLLFRIHQLFPESCTTCAKTYTVQRLDKPTLQCYQCEKGCCPSCADKYAQNIKSCELNDIFWACSTCVESRKVINEEKENRLKKSSTKSKNPNQATDTTEETVKTTEAEKTRKGTETEETIEIVEDVETVDKTSKENRVGSTKKENNKPCNFYKNNKCKFGISGKGCNFKHEQPCTKILKHGLGGRFGCSGKCDKFHPKMCRTSLAKRECYKVDCTYKHLPNTTREKGENRQTQSC